MFRTTIMAAVSALALSAGAHADDMFRSVQPVAAADDGLPGSIEFGQLNSAVMDMHAGDRIDLNFGAGYEAEMDRITVGDLGARTWVGRIAGMDIRNRVIITGRRATATLTLPNDVETKIDHLPLMDPRRRAIDRQRRELIQYGWDHAETQPRLTVRQRGQSGTLRIAVNLALS